MFIKAHTSTYLFFLLLLDCLTNLTCLNFQKKQLDGFKKCKLSALSFSLINIDNTEEECLKCRMFYKCIVFQIIYASETHASSCYPRHWPDGIRISGHKTNCPTFYCEPIINTCQFNHWRLYRFWHSTLAIH